LTDNFNNKSNDNSADNSADNSVRINKYIADSGFCSRREADELIRQKQVTVNDVTAELGTRVSEGMIVKINGQPVLPDDDLVYLAVYKPVGITCTTDENRGDNIVTWLGYPKRVFPVGRLDRDSEGLIFMTNDGNIVNKILRAGNYHEKEYIVTVNKDLTDEFIASMSTGVPILNTVTRPCRLKKQGSRVFRIVLTQGLNRQIRRMCEYHGYDVTRLIRVRIMHVSLGSMKSGEWRNLTPKEVRELKRLTSRSASERIR
jgi:23S rRNA pseudouridine2604 synthase